ncbi:hypothetical protein C8Q79DRAFT_981162 [Trametes meyenii]|nr:hypothetical protein C8Q79DRAFT_981162 [Trametes meyenii]
MGTCASTANQCTGIPRQYCRPSVLIGYEASPGLPPSIFSPHCQPTSPSVVPSIKTIIEDLDMAMSPGHPRSFDATNIRCTEGNPDLQEDDEGTMVTPANDTIDTLEFSPVESLCDLKPSPNTTQVASLPLRLPCKKQYPEEPSVVTFRDVPTLGVFGRFTSSREGAIVPVEPLPSPPTAQSNKISALARIAEDDARSTRPTHTLTLHCENRHREEQDDSEDDEYSDSEALRMARGGWTAKRQRLSESKPKKLRGPPKANTKKPTRRLGWATAFDSKGPFYVKDGVKHRYSRKGGAVRKKLSDRHGAVWCTFCHNPQPEDAMPFEGSLGRIQDTPKRHLGSCSDFQKSRFYTMLREAGISPQDIIKRAIKEDRKIAVVINCPNNLVYANRLKRSGPFWTHEKVLKICYRATLYKMWRCECCPFPHWSTFEREV